MDVGFFGDFFVGLRGSATKKKGQNLQFSELLFLPKKVSHITGICDMSNTLV